MQPGVVIDSVSKNFGAVAALREFSAEISPGKLTGLVGPDGAGKTTLLRLLAALMQPDSGSITVAGHDVAREAEAIHRLTGYMPQRFGLYEELSVMENLRLYAELRELDRSGTDAVFRRLLDFTDLAQFCDRRAGQLSGGMKQKLGLACALMARPRVLLLDEPSVGVDPVSRRELWAMVEELVDDGMAVIWATAYLDEAERCDRVLLLDDGRCLFDGFPGDLTERLENRTFLVSRPGGDRRGLLSRSLARQEVRDGVIQGSSIRLVFAEGASPDAIGDLLPARAEIRPVPPRFEDAFVDLLEGGSSGHSVIAEKMAPVETTREVMVECRNLTRRFGNFTATDDVSFAVKKGEIFGLLGPNGAGKSTTFKMLCGLLRPSGGHAEVAGVELRGSGAGAKIKLGYMAQKFSLYGLLSVRQNLEFFSGVYGLTGARRRQRIDEMIEVFHLQPYLDQSPDLLPLGFKQRMALACALMHRPAVLFLDEPTSGVDPLTRREFWSHITGLVGRGVTVLVTTHFMEEAEYCDRVALVHRARLIALDTPDELKNRVRNDSRPEPSMEDAFVELVQRQGQDDQAAA